jgi:cytochrome c553
MKAAAFVMLALCSTLAWGADAPAKSAAAPAKPDATKGQAIASGTCAACHGADGNSQLPANPKLAGQVPEYLARQLADFKDNKVRKNPVMFGMASPLSADDMRNVAAWFGQQKAKPGTAHSKETIALGQKLYRGGDVSRGLPACASCHGATGAGVPVQYPRISGQFSDYTETQLRAFRAGERANDANGMMRAIATKLSDADIKAVSDYIAGLH